VPDLNQLNKMDPKDLKIAELREEINLLKRELLEIANHAANSRKETYHLTLDKILSKAHTAANRVSL
jgi:hypothetical protein